MLRIGILSAKQFEGEGNFGRLNGLHNVSSSCHAKLRLQREKSPVKGQQTVRLLTRIDKL